MSIAVPYSWLKQIPETHEKKEISPLGYPPPFPWEQFAAVLAKIFQLETCQITPSLWEEVPAEALFKSLGNRPTILTIDIAPLKGVLYWALAEKDLDQLMSLLITRDVKSSNLIDQEYRQGFYQFLALEVFNIFNKLEYDKGLTPHLLSDTDQPKEACLSQNLTISINAFSFTARLLLSAELQQAWQERFAERKLTVNLSEEQASNLQVVLHIESGKTELKLSEWKEMAAGDFLLLDHCMLEPSLDKGKATLTLNSRPIFRAKIKDGNLKILEFPLYHEVEGIMSTHDEENDELDDEIEDDEDYDEETFLESEDETLGDIEKTPPPKGRTSFVEEVNEEIETKEPSPKPALKELSLNVVIEVGRVQMSVKKFMELEPGHLLELNIHPENGVDLVVNGNIVGKGELLKIGDSLGVRILDK